MENPARKRRKKALLLRNHAITVHTRQFGIQYTSVSGAVYRDAKLYDDRRDWMPWTSGFAAIWRIIAGKVGVPIDERPIPAKEDLLFIERIELNRVVSREEQESKLAHPSGAPEKIPAEVVPIAAGQNKNPQGQLFA